MPSPGMLEKHYSPRAALTLFEGETDAVLPPLVDAAARRIGPRANRSASSRPRRIAPLLGVDRIEPRVRLRIIGSHDAPGRRRGEALRDAPRARCRWGRRDPRAWIPAMMGWEQPCRIACDARRWADRAEAEGSTSRHRNPAILEARASEQRQDETVVAHAFFDAVGFQVLVVDAPARVPQQRAPVHGARVRRLPRGRDEGRPSSADASCRRSPDRLPS